MLEQLLRRAPSTAPAPSDSEMAPLTKMAPNVKMAPEPPLRSQPGGTPAAAAAAAAPFRRAPSGGDAPPPVSMAPVPKFSPLDLPQAPRAPLDPTARLGIGAIERLEPSDPKAPEEPGAVGAADGSWRARISEWGLSQPLLAHVRAEPGVGIGAVERLAGGIGAIERPEAVRVDAELGHVRLSPAALRAEMVSPPNEDDLHL
jgi:hypothetical protein